MFGRSMMSMRRLAGPAMAAAMSTAMSMPARSFCDNDTTIQNLALPRIKSQLKPPEILDFKNGIVEVTKAEHVIKKAGDISIALDSRYEAYEELYNQAIQDPLKVDLREAEKLFSDLNASLKEMKELFQTQGGRVQRTVYESQYEALVARHKRMASTTEQFRQEILQKVPIAYLQKHHTELLALKDKWEVALSLQDPQIAEKMAEKYLERVKDALQKIPLVAQEKKESEIITADVTEIADLLKDIADLKGKTEEEIKKAKELEKAYKLDKTLIEWCQKNVKYAEEVDPFVDMVLIPAGKKVGLFETDWKDFRSVLKKMLPSKKPEVEDSFKSVTLMEQAVDKIDVKALLEGRVLEGHICHMAEAIHAIKGSREINLDFLKSIVKERAGKGFAFIELEKQMEQAISKLNDVFKVAYENVGGIILGENEKEVEMKQKEKVERTKLITNILLDVETIKSVLEQYNKENKNKDLFTEIERMRRGLHALSHDYTNSASKSLDGQPDHNLLDQLRKAHSALENKIFKEAMPIFKETLDKDEQIYRGQVIEASIGLLTDIAPRWKQDVNATNKELAAKLGISAEQATKQVLDLNEKTIEVENGGGVMGAVATGVKYATISAVALSVLGGAAYVGMKILGGK